MVGAPLLVPSPLPCRLWAGSWAQWGAVGSPWPLVRVLPSLPGPPELAGLVPRAECACLVLVVGWALLWGAALGSLSPESPHYGAPMKWACFQHLRGGGGRDSPRQARPMEGSWFLAARWWPLFAVE